jgi:CBS domain-containing protein
MDARDLVVPLPAVSVATSVRDAARLVADQHAPGLIITDESGAVLGAISTTQLLRMALPTYLSQAPGLTRSFGDSSVASLFDECADRTVGSCMSGKHATSPTIAAGSRLLEVAELMARADSPVVAVVDPPQSIVGAVTADAVMLALLQSPH